MIQSHPSIHPNTANKRFKFTPFLQKEFNLTLNPDRPPCLLYNPHTNTCPNSPLCPNKHIPPMYHNKIVCKHWLRSLCKKSDRCEFLHEYNLRKMPECLFFSKNGFCTQSECLYLHIDPNSKIAECPLYNRGYCPDGPKCSKRHIRRVICPLYLLGFCPKGLECDLSHPKYEPSLSTPSLGKTDEDFMNELKKKKLELLKMKELKREREDSGDSLGKRQRIDY